MMKNIEKVLQIFFRRVSSEMVIRGQIQCDEITENDFVVLVKNYLQQYSETELSNMYNYLTETFLLKYHAADELKIAGKGIDLFTLFKCYCAWLLKYQNNEVVCEYLKLFRWRKISLELSEDMLVAAFLAQRDYTMLSENVNFGWKSFISHNNVELKKIINQGICENHYHLKGSAPFFQLSWISIMNNVDTASYLKHLHEIDNDRRNANKKYILDYEEVSLSVQVIKAALIRLFFVSLLLDCPIFEKIDQSSDEGKSEPAYVDRIFQKVYRYLTDNEMLLRDKSVIQGSIQSLKNVRITNTFPDYALYGLEETNVGNRYIFEGERWFLYEMFRRIFGDDGVISRFKNLFYAYLLIKENIRAEFVQNNAAPGFENFRKYQDRKEYFLEDSFFENHLVKSAIQSSLFESNVVTLEARITPKLSAKDIRLQIQKYDRIIGSEKYGNRYFYTMHFVKTGMERFKPDIFVAQRHDSLRKRVEQQARAIALVREKYSKEGARIRGIDAANIEIGCGPEVFAQEFRFLSDHIVDHSCQKVMPQLRMTYHAGEDFLDIVSGLRAIDEAIHFLNLDCGSRIGHALALGINVNDWYNSKNNRIMLSRQECLDNIVWLYIMIIRYKLEIEIEIVKYLEQQYSYYFNMIFGKSIHSEVLDSICERAERYYNGFESKLIGSRCITKNIQTDTIKDFYMGNGYDFGIYNYYKAWTLRGDNPNAYKRGFFEKVPEYHVSRNHYEYYYINYQFPNEQEDRFIKEVGILYYMYHFDEQVRQNGDKSIEIKVRNDMIGLVEKVQRAMQKMVAERGIGIECNPSSNYLIGTFKRYDEHPIIKFYNKGLTNSEEVLDASEQINVSINTDDQGVFNVSLENEYAYMALALEKIRGEDGKPLYKRQMIYQWIDDIRKMGINQTFLSNEEMRTAFDEWKSNNNVQ